MVLAQTSSIQQTKILLNLIGRQKSCIVSATNFSYYLHPVKKILKITSGYIVFPGMQIIFVFTKFIMSNQVTFFVRQNQKSYRTLSIKMIVFDMSDHREDFVRDEPILVIVQ